MLSIDLKDAYLHVPICPEQWKFLRFRMGMRTFEFKVLPFGITSAPRVFTKVIAPVTEHIRRTMGLFNCAFLNDSWGPGQVILGIQILSFWNQERPTVSGPKWKTRDTEGKRESRRQSGEGEIRQYNSSGVHKQTRGDPLCQLVLSSMGNVELVQAETDHSSSGIHTGKDECITGSVLRQGFPHKWSLCPTVAKGIFQIWGTQFIDLFANSLTKKLPIYC